MYSIIIDCAKSDKNNHNYIFLFLKITSYKKYNFFNTKTKITRSSKNFWFINILSSINIINSE